MRPISWTDAGAARPLRGFTLMEMIISLVVLGLLATVMLPMLTLPMNSYMDARRRVELQSQLDLVRSKIADDLGLALPRSVRTVTVGNVSYLEYLQVRATGRYRNGDASPLTNFCGAAGDTLSGVDTCFTTLGPLNLSVAGVQPVPGLDRVAVLGPASLPYAVGPLAPMSGLTAQGAAGNGVRLNFNAHAFPAMSPSSRFYVVSQPVTYECNGNTGQLTRHWGYAIQAAQPLAFGAAIPSARLADAVNVCAFSVDTRGLRQTVSLRLRLNRAAGGAPTESIEAFMQFGVREP